MNSPEDASQNAVKSATEIVAQVGRITSKLTARVAALAPKRRWEKERYAPVHTGNSLVAATQEPSQGGEEGTVLKLGFVTLNAGGELVAKHEVWATYLYSPDEPLSVACSFVAESEIQEDPHKTARRIRSSIGPTVFGDGLYAMAEIKEPGPFVMPQDTTLTEGEPGKEVAQHVRESVIHESSTTLGYILRAVEAAEIAQQDVR